MNDACDYLSICLRRIENAFRVYYDYLYCIVYRVCLFLLVVQQQQHTTNQVARSESDQQANIQIIAEEEEGDKVTVVHHRRDARDSRKGGEVKTKDKYIVSLDSMIR